MKERKVETGVTQLGEKEREQEEGEDEDTESKSAVR
jgi:hypothetical protein